MLRKPWPALPFNDITTNYYEAILRTVRKIVFPDLSGEGMRIPELLYDE